LFNPPNGFVRHRQSVIGAIGISNRGARKFAPRGRNFHAKKMEAGGWQYPAKTQRIPALAAESCAANGI
jgi:hypothetical protein